MSAPPPGGLVALLYERARAGPLAGRMAAWRAVWELIHGAPGRKRAVDTAALAARYRLDPAGLDLHALLYAVEACLALRARAMALSALRAASGAPPLAEELRRAGHAELARLAERLLGPDSFADLGVLGFSDAELFDVAGALRPGDEAELLRAELLGALARDPAARGPDALRAAYHQLLPKQVRHGLGAYYTPHWLAQYTVDALWERLPAGSMPRAIDPACGSGVFLLAAMERLAAEAKRRGAAPHELPALLVGAAAGVDINLLAVQSARANVVLLLARALAERGARLDAPLTLPVLLGDALAPETAARAGAPFDLVAGNPPWVNWEYLPPEYRERTRHQWSELGLYERRGRLMAFGKEDISALFTYAACARFLAPGGLLGFVLPQSLLKSSLNGRGFRRMRLASGEPLAALQVDDMVALRPFEGVVNRPAVLLLRRGAETRFPVPYRRWRLAGARRSAPEDAAWETVRDAVHMDHGTAAPTDPADPSAPWVDGPAASVARLARISGEFPYRARSGMFTGGANAVFYVELIEELAGGLLRVRNLVGGARRAVPAVEAVVEPTFVFPLLRGRELAPWSAAGAGLVICPHTASSRMEAVPPEQLRAEAPLTYAYLEQFRAELGQRRGFVGWEQRFREQAFYACQRIGSYTFAPYKVAWRYIAPSFQCAVIGPAPVGARPARPVIPHEKLMILPFDDPGEAHYVCGVLSSAPAREFVQSRMVETQIAPHVVERLALPRYDAANPAHQAVAAACRSGHQARASGDTRALQAARDAVDALLPELLPISAAEVAAAREAVGP